MSSARRADRPIVTPIVQATTFEADSQDVLDDIYEGRAAGDVYTRYSNPTVSSAAARVADLEGAEAGLLFASGMAAITTVVLTFASAGGRVIAVEPTYGGTTNLLEQVLPRFGVKVERFPAADADAFEALLADGPADLAILESPTNPTLALVPLRRVCAVARGHGVPTVVDSTFATPVNSRPLELGVDLVLHSATKYLAGHSDVMGGAVAGAAEIVARVDAVHRIVGALMDPHAAFLLERGLKTLRVRVERQNATAMQLACRLSEDARVERVHYPGLPSHPQHALAREQMPGGFGGMVSFDLAGGEAEARRFADALRVVRNAASLGGVESLVTLPIVQSHRRYDDDALARAGISRGCVRISCGIEDEGEIIADILRALDAAGRA